MKEKLQLLEQRIDELLSLCHELGAQNKHLQNERDQLLEKTSLVHSKVKTMINEIKTLEGQV